jgi:hypothetical protein
MQIIYDGYKTKTLFLEIILMSIMQLSTVSQTSQ